MPNKMRTELTKFTGFVLCKFFVVARASRPCVLISKHTGETPVPLFLLRISPKQ